MGEPVTPAHLPAVRLERLTEILSARAPVVEEYADMRLVSACGRRGPIRARGGDEPRQEALFHVPAVTPTCRECCVAWDRAEEAGQVRDLFTANGEREWASGGAPVFVAPARRRHRSGRSLYRDGTPKDLRLQVVVRDETPRRRGGR